MALPAKRTTSASLFGPFHSSNRLRCADKETTMKTIISVDPGLVTGVGTLTPGSPEGRFIVKFEEIPGGIAGFARWWDVQFGHDGVVGQVYIEDWMVRPNTHKLTPQPDPYLIIGYIQGWCSIHGIPLLKIGPGEHKSFNGKGKQSKVRRIGWITETTPDGHAEDGASVLLSGLLRTHRDLVTPLLKEIA